VQKPRHHQRGDTSERALRKKVQDSLEQEPTSFRVATFNVLGASHTAAGGNKKGWASGSARMAMATSVIQGSGADIVGLQELEIGQARTFLGRTNGAWGLYPGPGGGTLTVRNSVAWRTSVWELVSSRTVPIPYFHGNRVPMPVVELRNRETDQTVYVMNIHNPATTSRHGNNQRWRTMAMSIELDTVRGLQDDAPVILTGDFNERSEAFCKMTSGGTMRAAVPAGAASGCGAPANTGIDWVFATPHVDFSGYLRQRSALIARATDHPFVVANATITPTDSSDE
jgi:endonuclease/exonuclease/phosphatase family metal-dependent hydrolase